MSKKRRVVMFLLCGRRETRAITSQVGAYGAPMTVTIRTANIDDVAAVLALWLESDAEPSHTDDPAGVTALLERDPEALIVAEHDGRIVGSVIAADGWRGSIYRLAVAPEVRRRGLGRRLLEGAHDRLHAAGARRIQAIVVETDERATSFWRAAPTWQEQSERLRFVRG